MMCNNTHVSTNNYSSLNTMEDKFQETLQLQRYLLPDWFQRLRVHLRTLERDLELHVQLNGIA